MSALYLHIPFCKQACHYCDFHFSTNTQSQAAMAQAIAREIALQREYLIDKTLTSIYFGGGTPSLLRPAELEQLLHTIDTYFSLVPDVEITLEANPDDLSPQHLANLKALGINRLSIGIQSFHEEHLKYLHRAHDAAQAHAVVRQAQACGFENITIDLIYAIPAPDHSLWAQDLAQAVALDVPHISAYCLTIEEKTVFGNWLKRRKIAPIDEDFAATQYEMLVDTLDRVGYEHYEISNFARPPHYSRHNSNYWKQGSYLGVGPSAHSYDGQSRQYNIANNARYIQVISEGHIPAERELLSAIDHANEYLMTGLRTIWGVDLAHIVQKTGLSLGDTQRQYLITAQQQGLLYMEADILRLSRKGRLLADAITEALFWEA